MLGSAGATWVQSRESGCGTGAGDPPCAIAGPASPMRDATVTAETSADARTDVRDMIDSKWLGGVPGLGLPEALARSGLSRTRTMVVVPAAAYLAKQGWRSSG